MAAGGGVFGIRALVDKKTGNLPRSIKGPDNNIYEYEEIKHFEAKDLPFMDDKQILAEYRPQDKKSTIGGTGKGAFVATVAKNGTKKFIVGYNMPKAKLEQVTSVSPKKLKPQLNWFSAGGGESLGIQATTLIKGGTTETSPYLFGETNVKCLCFTDAQTLIDSVMSGLKSNSNITNTIISCLEEYFAGDLTSIGCDDVSNDHMNQIAKYVGEIIPSIAALRGNSKPFTTTPPWKGKKGLKAVFPDDPQFKGVDSVIMDEEGNQYPISSKSAKGASASFVGNVLATGAQYCDKFDKSYFKELCEIKSDNPRLAGPAFAFEAGLNKFLNMNVGRPGDVLADIKSNLNSPDKIGSITSEVAKKIRQYPKPTGTITSPTKDLIDSNLPYSTTAFLAREIANKIMSDKKSVDQIEGLLAGKQYYQANLNLAKFKKNVVEFKVTKTDNLKFKLTAGKGQAKDPTMSQGILNFFLV